MDVWTPTRTGRVTTVSTVGSFGVPRVLSRTNLGDCGHVSYNNGIPGSCPYDSGDEGGKPRFLSG